MQLRLSELKLPLEHQSEDLPYLAARTLGLARHELAAVQVYKHSFDARKAELLRVYIVDITLTDPAQAATLNEAIDGRFLILRQGRRQYHLVRVL